MSEKLFPILNGAAIPWALIEPHEQQALNNHDQNLAALAQRGGLDPSEALAVLEDRSYSTVPDAKQRLEDYVRDRYYIAQLAALREENERLRRDLDSVSAALISADTYLSGHCNGPCCVDPVMPITKESTK